MAKKKVTYDVVILGGGPAGMSAAVWCADLKRRSLLVERKDQLGGQLLRIFAPIKNYLGVETRNGEEMRDRFLKTLLGAGCEIRFSENIREVDLSNKTIRFESGEEVESEALIIATGVRRRKLGVEGEEKFVGRGILTSGAKEKEQVKGSNVVIIGGGDAALENALILSAHAEQVTVVHRRNKFSARTEFVDAATSKANVEFRLSTIVKRFAGDDRLKCIDLRSSDGSLAKINASFALVRIGVEPNSEIFRGALKLNSHGYIEVSQFCETSSPKVYAIGDVAFPTSPTIATAVGSAATACKHIASTFDKLHVRSSS